MRDGKTGQLQIAMMAFWCNAKCTMLENQAGEWLKT